MRLILFFMVVPFVELWLILRVHHSIKDLWGPLEAYILSLGTVIFTGVIGARLAKRQGLGVWRQIQTELARGIPPEESLFEGLLVLVGAVLLLTPGYLTDIFGFMSLLPWTRAHLAKALKSRIQINRVEFRGFSRSPHAPSEGPVIDIEAKDHHSKP